MQFQTTKVQEQELNVTWHQTRYGKNQTNNKTNTDLTSAKRKDQKDAEELNRNNEPTRTKGDQDY